MIQLGGIQYVEMQMIDRREGTEAVETDAKGVRGWVTSIAALAAVVVHYVSSQQSCGQIDGLGCQLLRQTLLGVGYEETMAKHERADVDQYAMALAPPLVSVAQHRQHLVVAPDPVEVEFGPVKGFVHVHLLRHRGGSLQGK